MDAYDLIEVLKIIWQQNVNKSSGTINKSKCKIGVLVHTDEGFRNVVGAVWDPQLKKILLKLDDE
jgi:hypothetical protein